MDALNYGLHYFHLAAEEVRADITEKQKALAVAVRIAFHAKPDAFKNWIKNG